MLHLIESILMVLAVVCLLIEAASAGTPRFARLSLGWLGLAFWAAVVAIGVIS